LALRLQGMQRLNRRSGDLRSNRLRIGRTWPFYSLSTAAQKAMKTWTSIHARESDARRLRLLTNLQNPRGIQNWLRPS